MMKFIRLQGLVPVRFPVPLCTRKMKVIGNYVRKALLVKLWVYIHLSREEEKL